MCAQNKGSEKPSKKRSKVKVLLGIVIVLVIVGIIGLMIVPMYVSSSSGNRLIVEKINSSVDGTVEIGDLSMGWFRGIKVEGLQFDDTAGTMSVNVEKITSKPSYFSFLGKSPDLGKTVVDRPVVSIRLEEDKEKTSASDGLGRSGDGQIFVPLAIMDLTVNDGNVRIDTVGGRSVSFEQIAAKLDINGLGKKNDIELSVAVNDTSRDKSAVIKSKGSVRPVLVDKGVGGWSLAGTSGDFDIEIDGLELSSFNPLLDYAKSNAQAKGLIDAEIKVSVSDGKFDEIISKVDCRDIDIVFDKAAGKNIKTSVLRADVSAKADKEKLNVSKMDVSADWLEVEGSGYIGRSKNAASEFDAEFALDVAGAARQMPKTFAVREGVVITKGLLEGNVKALGKAAEQRIKAEATLLDIAAMADGKEVRIDEPVEAKVNLLNKDGQKVVEGLDVSSSFANVKCAGTAERLEYSANANLSKLQNQLGQLFDFGGYKFAGSVESAGTFDVKKENVVAVGNATVKNLQIEKGGVRAVEDAAVMGYVVGVDRASEAITIEKIDVDGTLGKVKVSDGFISSADDKMRMKIEADAELAKLMPFAVMAGAIGEEFAFSGKLDSVVSIARDGDELAVRTSQSRIDRPKMSYKGEAFFEQDFVTLDFDGEIDASNKAVAIEKLRLISPQIKITKGYVNKSAKGGKTSVEARFDYDVELEAVSKVVDQFTPEGFVMRGKLVDSLAVSSYYPSGQGELFAANMNAKTSFGFDSAEYMGLNIGETKVDVDVSDGVMNVRPFSTVVNEGKLNFAAEADFREPLVMLKVPGEMAMLESVVIDKEMADLMLKYINPIFANVSDVSGLASFYCKAMHIPLAGGTKNDIVVQGIVDMNDVQLSGSGLVAQIAQLTGSGSPSTVMKLEPTEFTLAKGRLHYDDMQINFGNNPLNFSGDIFLNKQMDVTVELPWTLSGRTARVGDVSESRVELRLVGTVDDPSLDTDKLLEEGVKQYIDSEIGEFLKNL